MGLPLYNPPTSLYLSDLEPEEEPDDEYGPGGRGILTRRVVGPTPSPKHARRHHRDHHNQQRSSLVVAAAVGDYHPAFLRPPPPPPTPVRERLTRERRGACRSGGDDDNPRGSENDRRHGEGEGKRQRKADRAGRDAARSDRCAGSALLRRPSLEREEAFCGDRPGRKRGWVDAVMGGDETTAELYRLGLLYDDPHERGDLFNLDAIVRDEPVYGFTVGTRRRGGRNGKVKGGRKRWDDWSGAGLPLELELSFAALEEDERLAALMLGSVRDEVGTGEVERWTDHRDVWGEMGSREAGLGNSVIGSSNVEGGGLGMRTKSRETETRWQTQEPPASQDFPEMMTDSGHDGSEGVEWEVLDGESESCGGSEAWVVLD